MTWNQGTEGIREDWENIGVSWSWDSCICPTEKKSCRRYVHDWISVKEIKGEKNRDREEVKEIQKTATETLFLSVGEREGSKGTSCPLTAEQHGNRPQQKPEFCAFGAMANALLMESFSIAVWSQTNSFHPSITLFHTRFAHLQQNWWQLNRMEFISSLEIVLAAYSFPAEQLQITPHLCEVAEFWHPTIPPVQSTSWELHHCHLTAICPSPEPSLSAQSPSDQQKLLPR